MKTALIFGSSGLIGKNILDLILGSNKYKKIKLFVRINPELEDSRIEIIKSDLENNLIVKAGDQITDLEVLLIDKANQHDFIHYEISNFGEEGYFSKHNTAYWQNKHYLGIGPSAHSYNGKSRSWNISSNKK